MIIKKGVIISLTLLVFLLGTVIAGNQLINPSGPDQKVVKECRKNCVENFKTNTKMCNDDYKNSVNSCNRKLLKEAIKQCQELDGDERKECIDKLIGGYRQCLSDAKKILRECKDNAQNQKDNCINMCENPDTDNDGVADKIDNCPNNHNPYQEDFDHDNVGDACDTFECCRGSEIGDPIIGECFQTTIAECQAQGGAVMECGNIGNEIEGDSVPAELRNLTIVRFNASDSALVNLTRDAISTGVNNTTYSLGVYDCRHFAHDLERNLTALGHNATWTAFWCYGGLGNPPPRAHAVTDVHLPDGRTVFIEPQSNRILNLDFDGDGVVEVNNNGYTPGANMGQTDDNCKISVFEDRASAAAAGVPGA